MGHYEHWREDLALARDAGVQAIRWGVPWYRVEPKQGAFDWSWTDQVLPYLVEELGITPIVDLMHYGCPLWLRREFVNDEYPNVVASYAAAFALATWAALAGAGWLTPIAAVAGGAAYAWAGRRWWHSYQDAPAEHSRGEQTVVLVAAAVLALACLIALGALR